VPFVRIENALALCSVYLQSVDDSDPRKPELESYLVSGMVILIVSQYEGTIRRLFEERAAQCGDADLCEYVKSLIAREFRSPAIRKITDQLGKLGAEYRQRFSERVINTDNHTAWDSVMNARHTIVHQHGTTNMTLRDLRVEFYPRTKDVIGAIRDALELP